MAQRPGNRHHARLHIVRLADFRSTSTSSRFRDSFGSLKLGLRLRQSSAGILNRSAVIFPVSKPDTIGE